jgi:hypothetical protein
VNSRIQDTTTLATYRLICGTELVLERITWYDRTLIHEGTTVGGIRAILVKTMPMLNEDINNSE